MKRILSTLALILLLMAVALHIPSFVSANPVPYPSEPNKESPTLTVESPQNGGVYKGDTVEVVFAVTKPDSWNQYWLVVTSGLPVVGDYIVEVYVDGTQKDTCFDPCLRDVQTTNYSFILNKLNTGEHSLRIDVRPRTFYLNPNPGPTDIDYFSYQLDNVSDTIHFTTNSGLSPSPPTAPATTPTPTSSSAIAPQPPLSIDPNFSTYTGLTILIMVVAAFAGLLVYFKKRKR